MNMKKYVLAFFLCFISITPILAQRDHIDISNYILCINSYAESSPWSNRMISTVSEYVQKNPKLALYAEHMNTDVYKRQEHILFPKTPEQLLPYNTTKYFRILFTHHTTDFHFKEVVILQFKGVLKNQTIIQINRKIIPVSYTHLHNINRSLEADDYGSHPCIGSCRRHCRHTVLQQVQKAATKIFQQADLSGIMEFFTSDADRRCFMYFSAAAWIL